MRRLLRASVQVHRGASLLHIRMHRLRATFLLAPSRQPPRGLVTSSSFVHASCLLRPFPSQGDDIFEVEDALVHPVFCRAPAVKAGLVFYAAAILRSQNGTPMGTLCVLDKTPRALTEAQRRQLTVRRGASATREQQHTTTA